MRRISVSSIFLALLVATLALAPHGSLSPGETITDLELDLQHGPFHLWTLHGIEIGERYEVRLSFPGVHRMILHARILAPHLVHQLPPSFTDSTPSDILAFVDALIASDRRGEEGGNKMEGRVELERNDNDNEEEEEGVRVKIEAVRTENHKAYQKIVTRKEHKEEDDDDKDVIYLDEDDDEEEVVVQKKEEKEKRATPRPLATKSTPQSTPSNKHSVQSNEEYDVIDDIVVSHGTSRRLLSRHLLDVDKYVFRATETNPSLLLVAERLGVHHLGIASPPSILYTVSLTDMAGLIPMDTLAVALMIISSIALLALFVGPCWLRWLLPSMMRTLLRQGSHTNKKDDVGGYARARAL